MKTNYLFTIILFFTLSAAAQNTSNVEIDLSCQKFIGDVSSLDRTKYFSIHDIANGTEETAFRNEYNVTGGRKFWGPFGYAYNESSDNANERQAGVYPPDKVGNDNVKSVEKGVVSTSHPNNAFVDGMDIEAAANWAVEYNKDYVSNGDAAEFLEVMNEPFVHANEFYPGWNIAENNRIKLQMAQLYNEVGKKINQTPALSNIKVIGYSSAWPSMEINDFEHWNENMKMFMDTAGSNMFGFSTHLYDGINVTGQDTKRSGSNSEAILDLIENYSHIKWGTVKPHAITEYGAIEDGYGDDYSDIASAQTMTSLNGILFNLLDRENRLVNSIPFITGKATWHITAENNYQPYQATLWKPTNIGEPTPAGWEYTPRIHFYELWKDVKGERVFIKSDNPDVQSHAFLDASTKTLYIALNNLDENTQTVNLDFITELTDVTEVKTKSLKIYPQELPDMTISTASSIPNSIDLIKDETVVLACSFDSAKNYTNLIRTKSYYSDSYLKPINANNIISYSFNNVETGNGFASLRMAIGRKHHVSKRPIVKVNGTTVTVPTNWKGYDQSNRNDFFGMIEIPFDISLLQNNNTITLEFPDSGGTVSSLILNTEVYGNFQDAIAFESEDDVFESDTKIPVNITYTSNVDIPIDGIELVLWSVSNPWSQKWLRTQKNTTVLPAGVDITTTIDILNLPASVLNDEGTLMTDEELFAENPNNYTENPLINYYYEIRLFVTDVAVNAGFELSAGRYGTNYISIVPATELSIDEKNIIKLRVYPNPVGNTLHFSNTLDYNTITIYSAAGKKIKEHNAQKTIEVSDLTSGVYFIKTDKGEVSTFIKK